jgi:hypothetical protein
MNDGCGLVIIYGDGVNGGYSTVFYTRMVTPNARPSKR